MDLVKKPSDCIDIEDVRLQIDAIDKKIIELFSLRSEYVHEIVKFKTDEESVIAQNRKDLVVRLRGEWAEKAGLNRQTFEKIYLSLLNQNICEELILLEKTKK